MLTPSENNLPARMPVAEARACLATVRQALQDARLQLLELYERRGWLSLGYRSWREFCEAEFTCSRRHLYRLISAAQVERDVTHGSHVDQVEAIPERQLRELARIDTAAMRREIWEEAQRLGLQDSSALGELVDRYLGEDDDPPAVTARTSPAPRRFPPGAAAAATPETCDDESGRWPDRLRVVSMELRAWHPNLGPRAPLADRALDRYLQTVDAGT